MRTYELITPEGTRDLLFDECLAMRDVENRYRRLFGGMGYSEVVTPCMEFFDVFGDGSRRYSQESLYKLTDTKGRLLTLRPDCTIPIARLVATRLRDAKLPLRLFYTQTVYENNKLLKGRTDETVQAGIELIGSEYKRADFECLTVAVGALRAYEGTDFRLEIGDVGYFQALVKMLGVSESVAEDIRFLIEAKNYPALNDLLDGLGDNDITAALKKLPALFGGEEVFEKASRLAGNGETAEVLDRLRSFYTSMQKLGLGGRLSVDLGIVNRTDYYTGLVFKGYLSGVGEAVLQGGRYNRLIGEFGYSVPATGFAINVNAVASLLRKLGLSPKVKAPDAVVFGEKGCCIEAISLCLTLAEKNMTVENSVSESLGEAKRSAAERGIKSFYIVGETVKKLRLEEGSYVE